MNSGPISPTILTVCAALNGKCRRRQFIVSTATSLFQAASFGDPPLPSRLLAQSDCARKFSSVEGSQVLDALPYPYCMHRKAELGRNCDQNSAARGAVELGHDETRNAGLILEYFDLIQAHFGLSSHRAPAVLDAARSDRSCAARASPSPARSISACLFCSRPAVSISNTSLPFSRARLRASKASPAASAPTALAITSAPVRSPQILS